VGYPEPFPDLLENILHLFSIPKLFEDDDLVVSEMIAIVVVCHSRFSSFVR